MHERALARAERKYIWCLAAFAPSECLNDPAQVHPRLQPKRLHPSNIRIEHEPQNYRLIYATPISELAEWGVASLIFACCCFRISRVEQSDIHLDPMDFELLLACGFVPIVSNSLFILLVSGTSALRGLMHFAGLITSIPNLGGCSMTTLCIWKHR